jgi:hypothetical protein
MQGPFLGLTRGGAAFIRFNVHGQRNSLRAV